MSDQDDFVTIQPRKVALSHREEPQGETAPARTTNGPHRWAWVGIGVLALLGLWVFVFLPGQISPPSRKAPPAASEPTAATPAPATPSQRGEPAPLPYQQVQSERERKRAQDTLSSFVKLQIKLEEEMHVEQWAAEAFRAAQGLANEGDELFADERFDDAIARYNDGIKALEKLVAQGEAQFAAAVAEGRAALEKLDADAASAAFERARQIYPDHPDVTAGLARTATLPDVLDQLAVAAERRADGDLEGARGVYKNIKALDPKTPGVDEALAELDALVAEIRFQSLLSDGYAALNERRFGAASKAFNAALAMRPGSAPALAGLEQVKQGSTLSRIDQLRNEAAQQESDEQWAKANATYGEALAVEGTLKFAQDGRRRTAARAKLDSDLEAAIAQPELLSSDDRFEDAVALYQRAAKMTPAGPRLAGQLDALEAVIERAAHPVPVTLVSDNATEITVYQVGFLGAFDRKQLNLRPGRYVIKGSRDGCRDVRVEVDVEPDMAPLDVRCQERL